MTSGQRLPDKAAANAHAAKNPAILRRSNTPRRPALAGYVSAPLLRQRGGAAPTFKAYFQSDRAYFKRACLLQTAIAESTYRGTVPDAMRIERLMFITLRSVPLTLVTSLRCCAGRPKTSHSSKQAGSTHRRGPPSGSGHRQLGLMRLQPRLRAGPPWSGCGACSRAGPLHGAPL